MDPFTALGLASNVIQIVDFSCKLVSKGQEIYKSVDGTSVENVDTEAVANDLDLLNTNLQRSLDASNNNNESLSKDDQSLVNLCGKCSELARELQAKLDSLKVAGKHRRWKSARQALKSVSGKDGIEQIANRLAAYRDEINLNITVSLRGRLDLISAQQSRRFDDLDAHSKAIMEAVLSRTTDIMNALPVMPTQSVDADPSNDLHEASRNGDRSRLRAALGRKDLEVNARDGNGQTALHLASTEGHSLLVQTLLNSHVQLEAENNNGQTALHCAAANGHWATLRTLLTSGANKYAEDDDQRTPVYYAHLFETRNHEACKWMLKYGHGLEARDDHGDNLLLFAALDGNEPLVRYLLDKRADTEVTGGAGATPLILAATRGDDKVVQTLLQKGARIEATDLNGSTALIRAAWRGHVEVVRTLLDQGANFQVKNYEDQTSLGVASGFRDRGDIIQLLVDKGAKPTDDCLFKASGVGITRSITPLLAAGADIEWRASDGASALINAAYRDRPATVQALLQQGANIDAQRKDGSTALSVAVSEGHGKVVQTLLENGADIESKAQNGDTALILAAYRDKPAILQVLLEHGANTEAGRNDGGTPLWIAAGKGNRKVVKRLLDHGANIECKTQSFENTPLLKATLQGHLSIVQLLLDRGANIEASNTGGLTALQEAAKHHKTKIADLLISRGANIESMDNGADVHSFQQHGCLGFTPLIYAVSQHHQVTTRFLLEKGAKLETKSGVHQRTALAEACYHDQPRIAAILLYHGADVETRDREGRTPLMHAAQFGHQDVVKLLLRYGAYRGAKDLKGATAIMLAGKEQRTETVKLLR